MARRYDKLLQMSEMVIITVFRHQGDSGSGEWNLDPWSTRSQKKKKKSSQVFNKKQAYPRKKLAF